MGRISRLSLLKQSEWPHCSRVIGSHYASESSTNVRLRVKALRESIFKKELRLALRTSFTIKLCGDC